MKAPICDFVRDYARRSPVRFHMPGHKGASRVQRFDITEIDGADALFTPNGIIEESEKNASAIFGSRSTYYSTEGSSLCIKAMLHLAKAYKNPCGRVYALAGRNAHTAFVSASILADFDIEWIYPREHSSYLCCKIEPDVLEARLENADTLPFAVYVTSPDYLGNVSDIGGLSRVCKKFDVPLIVDNAHGAYLKFTEKSTHPLDLGADMCCDSAHKTLPVLTGGAYLHISKSAPSFFSEQAKSVMCLYGSTSPSYLILQSLDRANEYLSTRMAERLARTTTALKRVKTSLSACGYTFVGDEEAKLTIDAKKYGYNGDALASVLIKNNIIPEFYDNDFVVLMASCKNKPRDFKRLMSVLKGLPKKEAIHQASLSYTPLERKMTSREAYFSKKVLTSVDNSLNCTIAGTAISCPPAVAIAVCGEEINEDAIALFKHYGIESISVVKYEI